MLRDSPLAGRPRSEPCVASPACGGVGSRRLASSSVGRRTTSLAFAAEYSGWQVVSVSVVSARRPCQRVALARGSEHLVACARAAPSNGSSVRT